MSTAQQEREGERDEREREAERERPAVLRESWLGLSLPKNVVPLSCHSTSVLNPTCAHVLCMCRVRVRVRMHVHMRVRMRMRVGVCVGERLERSWDGGQRRGCGCASRQRMGVGGSRSASIRWGEVCASMRCRFRCLVHACHTSLCMPVSQQHTSHMLRCSDTPHTFWGFWRAARAPLNLTLLEFRIGAKINKWARGKWQR